MKAIATRKDLDRMIASRWSLLLREIDLQAVFSFNSSKASALPRASSTGVVRVGRFAEVFEVRECVLLHSFVERAEVGRTMAERVLAEEMVEVPVDELPIETVVVGDEDGRHRIDLDPVVELLHHGLGIVELERLVAVNPLNCKASGKPAVGDRFELAVERLVRAGWTTMAPKEIIE